MIMPPIYLIHGMWSTPATFDALRARLEAAGHRTHAPALPFHDRPPSAPPSPLLGEMGVADYIAFLIEDIAKLPVVPIIAGHSLGGFLAQAVAARLQPPGLILFAPAATAATNVPSFDPVRTLWRVMLHRRWWRSPTRLDPESARWGIYNEVPADVTEAEIAALVPDSGRVLFEMALPFLAKTEVTIVDHARITAPALVIVGERDRITPAGIARATARLLPGAVDYHELPATGHWLWHGPTGDKVAMIVEHWLATTFRTGDAAISRTS